MTGRPAARYASISAPTLRSKSRLFRRSHLGSTLNESCASTTSSADSESGISFVDSIAASGCEGALKVLNPVTRWRLLVGTGGGQIQPRLTGNRESEPGHCRHSERSEESLLSVPGSVSRPGPQGF